MLEHIEKTAPDGSQAKVNLLDLHPERTCKWEEDSETGRSVLMVPKFQGSLLGRFIQSRMKNPYTRVRLDEYGTTVWLACNGKTTVKEIGLLLKKQFGDNVEPLYERLDMFLRSLEKNRLIRYNRLLG